MNIKQTENKYFMHTYKRSDLVVKKAKGQFLWDDKGKKYLDFFTGISVCNLGHLNNAVVKAAVNQLSRYAHVSNLYYAPAQVNLGEALAKKFNGKVFLSNTGAEANECALKIARKYGHQTGGRYEIISFNNSFHGRTVFTLAATGQKKFHDYLKPLPPKFVFADFNDINSVKKLINKKTVAIIVEPVQGEGGIFTSTKEFLKGLRALADKHNLVLIYDEIQCGVGRTGKFFAFENYGVKPDIVTLAKSIANGLPLGVTLANKKFGELFTYGDHGTTFGGNPVSCAAALEVVRQMTPKFLNKSLKTAKYLREKLENLKKKHSIVKEVRGLGLILGVDLKIPAAQIAAECLKKGLIINCTHNTVLRLLPPLTITKKDADAAVKIIDVVLSQVK
ncbi:aspartate aminotransferase family protein [Endomicrobium proavitum]|uniref:Acetylornithine aminotransferase n=1 Tax=Endomicrobium proavitum TaxID=1408281 RepID=A0A0G3WJT8_9BACT|nr:aspartate aminotransferase family protein [Endomicrobium proavitum]AKL98150.1 Acetylornithine aminotransferase [Endomicrobium proavitum]